MSQDIIKNLNLGSLGTIWALTRFCLYSPYAITSYQSGHQFSGETQAFRDFDYINLGGYL